MDAKSRANFINSVASETNIPCPNCGTSNNANIQFCSSCGSKITGGEKSQNNVDSGESKKNQGNSKVVFQNIESHDAFAKGLPDWSIEPPMVVVRRR